MSFLDPSNFKEVHSRTPHTHIGSQRGTTLKRLILTSSGIFNLSQDGEQINSKNGVLTFSSVCITSKTARRRNAEGIELLFRKQNLVQLERASMLRLRDFHLNWKAFALNGCSQSV